MCEVPGIKLFITILKISELEEEIHELKSKRECQICCKFPIDQALQCGHTMCKTCVKEKSKFIQYFTLFFIFYLLTEKNN